MERPVSELKKGIKIEIDGAPYLVTDFEFVKPGKGAGIYRCTLLNLVTRTSMDKTYRSGDTIKLADVEEKTFTYSYRQGEDFIFIDESYEQYPVNISVLGDKAKYLAEDMEVRIIFFKGKPIDIVLPASVRKKVIRTEPGVRGNTVSGNVTKKAEVEGNLIVDVPLFIKEGDIIKIDTTTGEYIERVS